MGVYHLCIPLQAKSVIVAGVIVWTGNLQGSNGRQGIPVFPTKKTLECNGVKLGHIIFGVFQSKVLQSLNLTL